MLDGIGKGEKHCPDNNKRPDYSHKVVDLSVRMNGV